MRGFLESVTKNSDNSVVPSASHSISSASRLGVYVSEWGEGEENGGRERTEKDKRTYFLLSPF